MMIYIGAIIVTVLFLVLTFDLRSEYNGKVYDPKGLFNSTLFLISSSGFFFVAAASNKFLWQNGVLGERERLTVYNKCLENIDLAPDFCNKFYGKNEIDRGLYYSIGEKVNDVAVVSDNLYTSYALLFIVLGVILTIALLVALAILKDKDSK